MKKISHEERTVREAIKTVKHRWGYAFELLGPELQQAVVRAQVLGAIGIIAAFEESAAGRIAALALQWPEIQP